jgi:hypothetical protein
MHALTYTLRAAGRVADCDSYLDFALTTLGGGGIDGTWRIVAARGSRCDPSKHRYTTISWQQMMSHPEVGHAHEAS